MKTNINGVYSGGNIAPYFQYQKGDSYLSLSKIRQKRQIDNINYYSLLQEIRQERINSQKEIKNIQKYIKMKGGIN